MEISLLDRINNQTANCVVVGLGLVGSMQLNLLLEAGFRVDGYDKDLSVVEKKDSEYRSGADSVTPRFSASDKILAQADIIFVCVRIDLDNGKPIIEPLRRLISSIHNNCTKSTFVMLVTTVPVGTTDWLAAELDKGSHSETNHLVGFSPERIYEGQRLEEVRSTPRLVSGLGQNASLLAHALISQLCAKVEPVSSPKVAEMSKLLENTFRTHCIALIGEITNAAQAWGIEATEVCEAAATKPFGYFPFHPGPGVGGHCLPNDLRLLEASFEAAETNSPLLASVRKAIGKIPISIVDRLSSLLDTPLINLKILIVGVGFKPGSSDTTLSPAISVAEELLRRKAMLCFIDEKVDVFEVDGVAQEKIRTVVDQKWDAILIISGDKSISIDSLTQASKVVLDAGGASAMKGDRSLLHRL